MEGIAIWGAGTSGKELFDKIEQNHRVVCFVDNNSSLAGTTINNVPIISANKLKVMINEGKVDRILLGVSVMLYDVIYSQIINLLPNFEEIYYVPSYWKMTRFIKYADDGQKVVYPFLGIEAVRSCNLKCNACMHFSNIVEELEEYDLRLLEKDLSRLRELFTNICCIRIAGGEPLLAPNLPNMIILVKKYFPDCMVELITNGLLLTRISEELIKVIHEYEVRVNITLYKPTLDMFDEIKEFCEIHEIPYIAYGTDRNTFTKRLSLVENENEYEQFLSCDIRHCNLMRYGRITHCPFEMHANYINEKFGTEFPEGVGCYYFSESISGKEIKKYMEQSTVSCRYCRKPERIQWKVKFKNTEIEDWSVEIDE